MTVSPALENLAVDDVAFDDLGLVPAIVQDYRSGEVLMLAYMNRESLTRTVETGETWFFSRSRQTLWNKGATSGNRQVVKWIRVDCDADTLLVGVEQTGGGACHVEPNITCFWRGLEGAASNHPASFDILADLSRVISERKRDLPEGSYTTQLFQSGIDRVAQKVGEEAVEVILAAKNHVDVPGGELPSEIADLLYHLMVLTEVVDLDIAEVFLELSKRRGKTTKKEPSA